MKQSSNGISRWCWRRVWPFKAATPHDEILVSSVVGDGESRKPESRTSSVCACSCVRVCSCVCAEQNRAEEKMDD
jgi:hypothetical protein